MLAVKNPLPILLIALIFGIAGAVADRWLPTNTDYEQLMPQDIVELQETRELRDILGYGWTLRFLVEASDVTDPDVLSWLKTYQDEQLALYPELLSVDSPAALISEAAMGTIPSRQQIEQILENTAPVRVEQVISADRRAACVSFEAEYMALERAQDLLQVVEQDAQLPDGVRIAPVGILALGAGIVDAMVGTRLLMNVLCLFAVFLVLFLVYRRITNTVFTIVAVGLVIAWTSLDMYLIGIPLNPLTAVLGVIIIGIGTEFMVLLIGRYDEEKRKGKSPRNAMVIAISRIGRAIVTTALTTLGGFGVLIASNFVLLRDFGVATGLGIFLCLVSAIAVMPPLIVWLDERIIKRSRSTP
jgi:hydrophobe/amphiphile efflux-3 (HAE3) family protein